MNKTTGRRQIRRFLIFAFLLALAATASAARDKDKKDSKDSLKKDYALIAGTVWTPDSHPAFGIPVKIRRADQKKAQWQLTSDHSGEFAQRVPSGAADYVIWAEVPKRKGPAAETKVHVDNDERIDVGLHLTE